MPNIARRIRSIFLHLASLRGLMLIVAALLATVAVVTSGVASQLAALAAVSATGLLLLLVSYRLSDLHKRLSSVERAQKKLAKSGTGRPAVGAPKPPVTRIGPAGQSRHAARVGAARSVIKSVRGEVAADMGDGVRPADGNTDLAQIKLAGPTITVVVPCHDDKRQIGKTLESVRRQSFGDWECVVVDDASTDASIAELQRFLRVDSRFRLIRHKVYGGRGAARNTGLRVAQGRFITFLDPGSMLMADSLLDRIETLAEADRDTIGAYCGVRPVPANKNLDSLPTHEEWHNRRYLDFVSANAQRPFQPHAPLMRVEPLRIAGGFDETTPAGIEDCDLWLRLMRRGYGFAPSKYRTAVHPRQDPAKTTDAAVDHVRRLQDHIVRSYSADESVLTPGSPCPFPLPLPVYQQQLAHAQQATQHAAAALARGDQDAAQAIMNSEGLVVESWMDRHLGFDEVIDEGFCQALGVNAAELRDLDEDLAPLRGRVHELLSSLAKTDDKQVSEPRPAFDVIFIPEGAPQAVAMIEAANALPETHTVAFVDPERISGSTGVATVLAAQRHQTYSINELVLGNVKYRNLVVAFPRGAVSEELVTATLEAGGRVAELARRGDGVTRVDDTPDYSHDLPRLESTDLGEWLLGLDHQNSVEPAGLANTGQGRWFNATDPDPDDAYTVEEYPATVFDGAAIERFRGIHDGERCVIIGNGPSLNKLDLTRLRDEYTIGVNGIFYASEEMGWDPSYYVVEDTAVMRDNTEAIKGYPAGHKFFPTIYRDQVGDAPNVTYFMMNRGYYEPKSPSYCVPRFSTDASQRLYSGQSVTIINLQLAYYMGFAEVVLIGMDFSYTIPDDAKIEGSNITSMSDDPNHFHPEYFGKGKVWKDPQLDRVLANYQLAKQVYEADGRRIVNATPGGKLELFDRVPYDELFG